VIGPPPLRDLTAGGGAAMFNERSGLTLSRMAQASSITRHDPAAAARPARTVLVVEDDTVIREALAEGLASEGFEVQEAGDGAEALALITSRAPDLILLDLMMPKMTGWQLMDELRKSPALHDIPVVIVTAARYAGSVPSGSPTFIKPLRLGRLIQSIRAFLG
jgi:DNA-binding response OmpR family regulator